MVLTQDEVISLTHLQHLEFKSIDGEYLTLLFNSNFYCIYGNDHEAVSYTHLTLPTKRIVEISVVARSLKKKKKRAHETDSYLLIKEYDEA